MKKSTLSYRENEILRLVSEGRTDQEVASTLGISRATVRSHIFNLRMKLDATNRVQLGAKAHELNVIGDKR